MFDLVVILIMSFTHVFPSRFPDLNEELSGSHLRFSASHFPPFMIINEERNGTFCYRGMAFDLINLIAELLNITYSFVNTLETEENEFGMGEASVNLLLRDKIDMIGLPLSRLDLCNKVDCSVPSGMAPYGLMVPLPKEENRISGPIKPFQPMVWLLLFVSLVIIPFALVWIPHFFEKAINRRNLYANRFVALNDAAMYATAILTNHSSSIRIKQLSHRIVVATWCLSAFVFVNAYSSIVTSYLMAPKLQPFAKSFEDIASGHPQKLQILSEKGGNLATNFYLRARSGPMKVLGDSLRQNPDSLFTSRKMGNELMDTGNYAYAAMDFLLYSFLLDANKRAGYCRFTISNKNLPITTQYSVYAFRKNWRFTNLVNYKLLVALDAGVIDYTIKINKLNINKCQLEHYWDEVPKIRKLTLVDLSGPFLILLLGLSISFLVFLVEVAIFRWKIIRAIFSNN